MITYSLTELSDQALLRGLSSLVMKERSNSALMLAHIAEVDDRKLYLPAAYSSMFDYCVGELRLSEGATYKRLNAARAALPRDLPRRRRGAAERECGGPARAAP